MTLQSFPVILSSKLIFPHNCLFSFTCRFPPNCLFPFGSFLSLLIASPLLSFLSPPTCILRLPTVSPLLFPFSYNCLSYLTCPFVLTDPSSLPVFFSLLTASHLLPRFLSLLFSYNCLSPPKCVSPLTCLLPPNCLSPLLAFPNCLFPVPPTASPSLTVSCPF